MHSDDGQYWWDGTRWVPAYSPDGRYWFDGTRLQPVPGAVPTHPNRGEVRRRGLPWWGITLIVVGALAVVGAVGTGIVRSVSAMSSDDPSWIDRDDLWDAAAAGCDDVSRTIEESPRDIEAGNAAIDRLVARVEAVGQDAIDDDEPTADWLADWATVEDARTATLDGSPFELPETSDGYPLSDRMIDASPDECVTAVLAATSPLASR